jgi:hypothetical protein
VNLLKRRYEVGLQKLLAAEAEVSIMKVELIELQPKLIETGGEPPYLPLSCCWCRVLPVMPWRLGVDNAGLFSQHSARTCRGSIAPTTCCTHRGCHRAAVHASVRTPDTPHCCMQQWQQCLGHNTRTLNDTLHV